MDSSVGVAMIKDNKTYLAPLSEETYRANRCARADCCSQLEIYRPIATNMSQRDILLVAMKTKAENVPSEHLVLLRRTILVRAGNVCGFRCKMFTCIDELR